MLKTVLCGFLVVLTFFAPTIAFAKSTGWIDLTSKKQIREFNELINRGKGQGLVYKKIECKLENSRPYAKIEYGSTGTQSIYYIYTDFWKNIEPEFKKYKRRGAIVVSRSDIKTNKGLFTCIIWRKWY